MQTVWTQIRPDRTSVLIWVQTVWHSDGINEIVCRKGWFWTKNQQTTKSMQNYPVRRALSLTLVLKSWKKTHLQWIRWMLLIHILAEDVYFASNSRSMPHIYVNYTPIMHHRKMYHARIQNFFQRGSNSDNVVFFAVVFFLFLMRGKRIQIAPN